MQTSLSHTSSQQDACELHSVQLASASGIGAAKNARPDISEYYAVRVGGDGAGSVHSFPAVGVGYIHTLKHTTDDHFTREMVQNVPSRRGILAGPGIFANLSHHSVEEALPGVVSDGGWSEGRLHHVSLLTVTAKARLSFFTATDAMGVRKVVAVPGRIDASSGRAIRPRPVDDRTLKVRDIGLAWVFAKPAWYRLNELRDARPLPGVRSLLEHPQHEAQWLAQAMLAEGLGGTPRRSAA